MTFDILIKNGTVVDGTGKNPAFRADVGILEDKIAAVGKLDRAKGREEIDAAGLIVAPGFVDIQNHSDSYGGLLRNPQLESLVCQGITTALLGQCGSSLAPLVKGSLASIQKWTNISGVNVNWTSLAEFVNTMTKKGCGINLATLVGHATIRRDFIGDLARPANSEEQKKMELLLKRSLQEGAWGLSIGLAYSHERLAAEEEIYHLIKIVQAKSGVVSFHLRSESKDVFASINEVFGYLRHIPVRAKISHLKILGEKNTATAEKFLNMLSVAARDGVPVAFDVYPFLASAVVLYLLLPDWATSSGKSELIKKIQTPTARADIIRDLSSKNYPYEKITIATSSLGQGFVGKNIAQIASDQKISPPEAVLRLLLASQDQIIVFWHDLEENILTELLKHPLAMIATDGSGYNLADKPANQAPHPRSFGTTAEILGKFVREKKILSLEEAVFKMSGWPASWLGLKDRGALTKNNFADLVVFDPEKIKNLSTYSNPFRYPAGINHVLINGRFVVKNGNYQKILAGRMITA